MLAAKPGKKASKIKIKREGKSPTAKDGKPTNLSLPVAEAKEAASAVQKSLGPESRAAKLAALDRAIVDDGFTGLPNAQWLQPEIGADQEVWLVQLPLDWDFTESGEVTLTDQRRDCLAGSCRTADGTSYAVGEEHDFLLKWIQATPGIEGGPPLTFHRRVTFAESQSDDFDLTALAEEHVAPSLEVQHEIALERENLSGRAAPIEILNETSTPGLELGRAVPAMAEAGVVPPTPAEKAGRKPKGAVQDALSNEVRRKKKKKKLKHGAE